MHYKEKVKTIFEEIEPALELFDWRRKEALVKTKHLKMVLFVVWAILTVLVLALPMNFPLKIIISTAIIGICIGVSATHRRNYVNKFKKDLSELLFDRQGIKATHESFNHLYSGHFEQSGLFEDANNYTGDDLITGTKNGLYFIGSELKAAYVRRRKKMPDINRTIFDGIYLCAELPKDIMTTVTIYSRAFKFESYKKIAEGDFDTLSKSFDKHFEVEYQDYDQTSHLLTPDFIKALVAFKEKHKYPFILKVSRNQVYLAVQEDKDFFKIDLKMAAHDQKGFEQFAEDCQFFFDVVKLLEEVK